MVEVTYCFSRSYVKFQGHTALKIVEFDPNWAFPDCNSSLTDGYEMLHKAWNREGEMPYCFPRSSIKFQGHTGQNFTDFDPNWAFPDYKPVAAFKSLWFALFIWTLYWIQPHLKTFTRPVMWVSWIFIPPPLGAGGIMFSGCPSVRPSFRPKPEIPSFDLYMGRLVHPTNRYRFTACPSVRPSGEVSGHLPEYAWRD